MKCGTLILLALATSVQGAVEIRPPTAKSGYIARLLLNEAAFPGERGFVSVEDTKSAMLAVLWVLHSRIAYIPDGYTQKEIAAIRTDNVIDVITVGGKRGQCDGFYRDNYGRPSMVPRVNDRIDRLAMIANTGKPGKFAQLLQYAQGIADAYERGGIGEADRFAGLARIGSIRVTGRAFSWMAGRDYYSPGGNFVKIPNAEGGLLGGNRFFTLKRLR